MKCKLCGRNLAFVDGGDWAGLRCPNTFCVGWAVAQADLPLSAESEEAGR